MALQPAVQMRGGVRKLVALVISQPRIHNSLRGLYQAARPEAQVRAGLSIDIPEIFPLNIRRSSSDKPRLNLLVPALSNQHVFGGIATALNFFSRLAGDDRDVRIILTDETRFKHDNNPDFSSWRILSLSDEDQGGRVVVPAGNRAGETLAVREHDYFVATSWWTALLLDKIIRDKKELWRQADVDRFVYIVQDYEPGFYAWSSRYALAESSYHFAERCIAVFNTSILSEFFIRNGYKFGRSFVFEPVLHSKLRPYQATFSDVPKERIILCYGRPTVSRNAFEIVALALKEAASRRDLSKWQLLSVGEAHASLDLARDVRLKSLGKLSIDEYGKLLQKSYAGISLMISPHPSYPPLEMAAFGIKAITNNYENKSLARLSDNIVAPPVLSVRDIADTLCDLIDKYEPVSSAPQTVSSYMQRFSSLEDPFSAVIGEVRSALLS
ncbi:glycosyltransferase [Rhizobium sp. BK399]|uniref:glycosyltransferase n=1 Tax=Rhizobium sp. BK399 TaxID=2587063 RepID=UPI00161E749B|nr:glycosyltransferase [Rhizobium sp. BK399]MBB3542446.1 hypothetical protein [Rhizobium sp. BK399]